MTHSVNLNQMPDTPQFREVRRGCAALNNLTRGLTVEAFGTLQRSGSAWHRIDLNDPPRSNITHDALKAKLLPLKQRNHSLQGLSIWVIAGCSAMRTNSTADHFRSAATPCKSRRRIRLESLISASSFPYS